MTLFLRLYNTPTILCYNIPGMYLYTSVVHLNRVGKTVANRLSILGIKTIRDLLFHFPFRYEDFSHLVSISQLQEGAEVTTHGKVELIGNKRSPRKRKIITEALVSDGTGQLRVVWFGQPFLTKNLHVGDEVYLSGRVSSDMLGMQMVSPVYERGSTGTHTARIVPMYPLTAGVTQKQLRFLMSQIIELANEVEDWLPEELRERIDLMPLAEAIRTIHFPENLDEIKHAERRLKFDELFVLQLRAEMIRQSLKRSKAPALNFQETEIKKFVAGLPFVLTKDQKVAAWEMLQDMQKPEPMNRLLEGDVGSGKTVVAALIMYNAVLNGTQAAIMAPTEILAKQHLQSLKQLLPEQRLALLTSSEVKCEQVELREKTKKGVEEEVKQHIAAGNIEVIIGTHALLTRDVQFHNLGLVVVDEQHRFGVDQRKVLKEKSGNLEATPHFLSMTATPIPRSFALTLYGDLDVSFIRQKPEGRKEIKTRLVAPHHRQKAYEFIRVQVQQGRQVFVICPLIESTDEKKSVMAEFKKLSTQIFSDLRVEYLHGKMKPKEKDEVMLRFVEGKVDVLVSTSVVEVGVNIPNASVMMIEGAERFGLAQLHQFRGRVGRAEHQSYCFLFTDIHSQEVQKRLSFFEKTTDGFVLAEYDLQTRGPGDVYGTAQSGMMQLRLATMRDVELIKLAREVARGIDFEQYPTLKEKVQEWENSVHLE